MKVLLQHLKPFRLQLILIGLLSAVGAVCGLLLPYFMSKIVDDGISVGNMQVILTCTVAMFLFALVNVVAAVIEARLASHTGTHFSATLRKELFRKVNSLTFEEYASVGTASFLTRQNEDVDILQEAATNFAYFLFTIPVTFIGVVVLAFLTDPLLAVIMLAVIPLIVLAVRLVTKNVGKLWDTSDKMMDRQNAIVRERLSGLRVIRAFDRENYEHQRIATATKTMSSAIVRANILSGFIAPVAMFLLNLATVLILYVGAVRMQNTALLTAGDIIAVVQYVAILSSAVISVSWMMVFLPHIQVALRRISEVLSMQGMESGEATGRKLDGTVTLSHVTFGYEKNPVLKDINFSAKNGEIIGVIGGTGSGKTTLAKLLLGFYSRYEGKITLGGVDYTDMSKVDLRDNYSIALQKSMIFEGTALENIRMGTENATEEQVKAAATVAQIDDFFSSQKDGYGYRLAQQGANISGGQKQRINIARTVLKPASVYVFDDSFSALDFLTESKLRRSLNRYLSGKTQIVITQRIATAMHCDKVYVLEQGEVVGCGTHEELLRTCPIYQGIYHSQLGGEAHESK